MDMDEPRFNIEIVNDFIKGKISEKEYFENTTDNAGKDSYNLPFLEDLKGDMNQFRRFLLTLSVDGRIRILLRSQLVGMSLTSISENFGVNKNKLNFLKGLYTYHKNKIPPVKIRKIKDYDIVSKELYSILAIFGRVPVSWIQEKDPEQSWSDKHFNDLTNVSFSIEEFYDYINHTEEVALKSWRQKEKEKKKKKQKQKENPFNIFYDISGIILTLSNFHQIFIRVSIYEYGGFIVEIFSENYELYDYTVLKDLLTRFGPVQTGYFETVIKYRFNPVIVCKSRSQKFDTPSPFEKFIKTL
jgi:hypothetical protein